MGNIRSWHCTQATLPPQLLPLPVAEMCPWTPITALDCLHREECKSMHIVERQNLHSLLWPLLSLALPTTFMRPLDGCFDNLQLIRALHPRPLWVAEVFQDLGIVCPPIPGVHLQKYNIQGNPLKHDKKLKGSYDYVSYLCPCLPCMTQQHRSKIIPMFVYIYWCYRCLI